MDDVHLSDDLHYEHPQTMIDHGQSFDLVGVVFSLRENLFLKNDRDSQDW